MPEFAARAGEDDQVHRVEAGIDALIDPSPYRTRCGQSVLEVYNTGVPISCARCARPDTAGMDVQQPQHPL